MIFSDTSSAKEGLVQEVESLLSMDYGTVTDDTSLFAQITNYLNRALEKVTSLIMQADGRWQWDDNNNTDYPIATTNLGVTAGSEQQDYPLSITHLRILGVEVQDSAGNWNKLQPIDEKDVYNQSMTDFLKTAGLPMYYDKFANSIFLYPKPLSSAVTATNGLKVRFQRGPSYFTTGDSTKQPGFSSLHHRLISAEAALDYARTKGLTVAGITGRNGNKTGLTAMVADMEQAIQDDYSLRSRDEKLSIKPRPKNYR